MVVPLLEMHLPELVHFTHQLAVDYQQEKLAGWPVFIERVRAFYTPVMMNKIEQVVPGWGKMASFVDQQTLIHVTSVLTTLWMSSEFQHATPEEQAIMAWMVVFHDVAKEARRGDHDYVHGFRGSAITGKALVQVGFPATTAYTSLIEPWFALTHNAIRPYEQEQIQDNTQLQQIISGIDQLYSVHTPAGWIMKGVLLHLSLPTDPDYPTLAPLNDVEIANYVLEPAFFPLLKIMYLVDTDSWNMFDAATHARHHRQTIDYFERIGARLGAV